MGRLHSLGRTLDAHAAFLRVAVYTVGTVCAACSSASTPNPVVEAEGGTSCSVPRTVSCPDPAHPPSYASDVAPLFHARCAPCHFAGGVSDLKQDFSTYSHVVNAQTGILGQLFACTMPPTSGNAQYGIAPGTVAGITVAQASTIIEWIGCGAPDN